MTETGILEDKQTGDAPKAKINGTVYDCLGFTDKYLQSIPLGSAVDYELTDTNKIKKIAKSREQPAGTTPAQTEAAKRKAAGFDNPPPASEKSTSPEKPAAATTAGPTLKTVEGQIVAIDHAAHKITVKDLDGQQHTMIWPPPLNDQMAKLKQWWFCKITGEYQPDVDLWKLTAQDFFKRPDDWPASAHGNGGGFRGQPRNERAIVAQCLLKCWTELYVSSQPGADFNAARDAVLKAVEADLPAILKAAGVQ